MSPVPAAIAAAVLSLVTGICVALGMQIHDQVMKAGAYMAATGSALACGLSVAAAVMAQ